MTVSVVDRVSRAALGAVDDSEREVAIVVAVSDED